MEDDASAESVVDEDVALNTDGKVLDDNVLMDSNTLLHFFPYLNVGVPVVEHCSTTLNKQNAEFPFTGALVPLNIFSRKVDTVKTS